MKAKRIRLPLIVPLGAALLWLSTATAEARWSHTATFRYARSTSVRVVEPQGFSVQLEERRDTIPAVFNLPGANAYVWVTITARDGQSWRDKVEVRERNETVLTVRYTAEQKAAPARGPARKFIGSITNSSHRCQRRDRAPYRFDFILDGKQVYSRALNANKLLSNVELPQGTYDVRVFKYQRRRFFYKTTINKRVTRDGWTVSYGCGR